MFNKGCGIHNDDSFNNESNNSYGERINELFIKLKTEVKCSKLKRKHINYLLEEIEKIRNNM